MARSEDRAISEIELEKIREEAMDFADVGLYRYRFSGEIIFMDRGALRLLDLEQRYPDPRAVEGEDIGSLFEHILSPGALRSAVRKKGQVRHFEYHYRTLSGEERWVYHHSYLVELPEPAIQVICQDITPLKLAQQAQASSEARYRVLIEQSLQGICVFKGDPPRLVFANKALSEILGVEQDLLRSATADVALEQVHPDDREALAARFLRRRRGQGDKGGFDCRIQRPDGSIRWLTGLTTDIEFDGEPAFQSVFIDITERKEAEAQRLELQAKLQQTQRLESLGMLASGIAHDFNNLLAAVLGHAELAAIKLPTTHDATEHFYEISRAAESAAELCRQMMVYAGQRRGSQRPTDLGALLEETGRLLAVSIPKKVTFTVDVGSAPIFVEGDPSQLRQVIINLLTNAAEALGDTGGEIRLGLSSSWCDKAFLEGAAFGQELTEGVYVAIEVTDTGCGLEPEQVERVFEPFYSTKGAGRGLGLAAVLGIIRAHSGVMRVESEPGAGTRFLVYLPRLDEGQPEDRPGQSAPSASSLSGTVLLVDDEAVVRRVATLMLRRLGFEVLSAADGLAAVSLFAEHRDEIDLVILDLSMPGLDGREVFEVLRRQGEGVPILFSSAYDEGHVGDAISDGEVGFIQKPYRLASLRKLIVQLLGELPDHP